MHVFGLFVDAGEPEDNSCKPPQNVPRRRSERAALLLGGSGAHRGAAVMYAAQFSSFESNAILHVRVPTVKISS